MQTLWWDVRQSGRLMRNDCGRGIVLGVAGVLTLLRVLSTVMSDLLFGIKPTDPATFVLILIMLFMVSLVACFVPARRATRVDPLRALHHD